jgi:hypothetical protein
MTNIEIELPVQLLDMLSDTAKEYSADLDTLITIAVKRLLENIEFTRDLRAGKFNSL